jgi:hypothetical protein
MKKSELFFILVFLAPVVLGLTSCGVFLNITTASIMNPNANLLPVPTLMFSGITPNNPGQMYECQYKTGQEKYNYFLLDWKNTSSNTIIFTGICVP